MAVKEPIEVSVRVDELGVGVYEGAGAGPERGEGARVVKDVHIEAVFEVVLGHEAEDVVVDVAEEVDLSIGIWVSATIVGATKRDRRRSEEKRMLSS